jgi:serine/threonine protein kinase/Tfp pilus assembly protein PilF
MSMSDRYRAAGPNLESTGDLLAGWNLDDSDAFGQTAGPPSATDVDPDGVTSPPVARLAPGDADRALQAGFGAGEPAEDWSLGVGSPGAEGGFGPTGQWPSTAETAPSRTVRPDGETAPRSSRTAVQGVALRPGDLVAGFRLIRELGRGAFARVFLAEEIHLGRRLVAIKLSRPEGDEPQNLARLQHTHIVPVHSVCDDPESGLRILCMPYFGGANLAQVLDAAGGLVPTERAGRSLVTVLDEINRSQPSLAGASTLVPARPARGAHSARPGITPAASGRLLPGEGDRSLAASRLRSFLSRLVGTAASKPAGPGAPELVAHQHQPARQFLHGASAVQAAAWIVARLAEGLDHAHSRGLLHRDLKPANILLAADGTPMLLDFNLAAEAQPAAAEDEIGRAAVGGTLPYMAPEHLDAFHPHGTTPPEAVDERADIYALGLILFEMLAGEPPFPGPPLRASIVDAIESMIASRRHVPSLRARCPQVPWSLDALVAKCLQFDPAGRYARAGDLAEDLRRFLEDRPMKHGPEPSWRERLGKFARRHPGLCGSTSIALISIVLVALLGTGLAVGYQAIQDLAARVQRQMLDRDFAETQFLLQTVDDSDRHLKQGIARAADSFGYLGLDDGRPRPSAGWARRLAPAERRRLREQVVELIILEARARVVLASRRGSEDDRRRAIERAIGRLDRVERSGPAAPAALFAERARYHAALGQADSADRDRRRAAATAPATGHDWTLLGQALLAGGDPAAAEDALRQALRLEVTSSWTWFVLGHCHYAQRRFLEAAGDFAVCAARGPDFAWVHFNRGLALARAGRLLDAKDAYDRALGIDPRFAEALVNRAMVELELNQLDPALADLTAARDLGRHDLAVLAALGETLARLGRGAEAERLFGDGLALRPADPVLRIARAMTRVRTDPGAAREDFLDVLRQDPRHAMAHYGMALLTRAADPPGAIRHLDAAIAVDPHLIDAVQLRALVRARLGDRAALDDVDRLIESPTPGRLYNAACAVALYAGKTGDARQHPHALELLTRALRAGFPADVAAADPDLKPLQALPEFRRLLAQIPKSA